MSEEIMRKNFLLLAAAYGVHAGLPENIVSKRIYGHQDFIRRYRDGETCPTIDNYYRMVDKMREGWPADAPWPQTLPIPKVGEKNNSDDPARAAAEGIG